MRKKVTGKPKVHIVLEFTKHGHGRETLRILKVFSDANKETAWKMGWGLCDGNMDSILAGKKVIEDGKEVVKSYAIIEKSIH